ncbi:serine/threonine protein phosphatase [Neorhizobium lilium]|uniref:Serine/threonine protein phosphatase n=1 Tax=Neorhizobium lilium TaxID=2503024 RepID=A0A3S3TVF6_9HYPH|nr:metallophosphoesterase family protein [Neorhizobium lilium]RWX75764.1 serine/threonine protein phosphatase [Neorhizobium lilium]
MRKLLTWLSQKRPAPEQAAPRRRIDMGDNPPAYPIYAIGDIHGCMDQLQRAEEKIATDIEVSGQSGPVVLLGDYVDRGSASSQVIEHLVNPSALGLKRVPLCGNHDDIFGKFIEEPDLHLEWLALGGEQTLMSYGIDIHHVGLRQRGRNSKLKHVLAEAIPLSHKQFLENLPIHLKIGQYLFVHAGIRPEIPLQRQTDEDMMWIREPFLKEGPKLPLMVIHGHTPQPMPDLGPHRIGIDTGAFYTGKLTVLKIDGGQTRFL